MKRLSSFARSRFAWIFVVLMIGVVFALSSSATGWGEWVKSRFGGVAVVGAQTPLPLSESAQRQIQALLDEKASRTPAQQKLDSQLVYAIKMRRGVAIATGVPTLEIKVPIDAQGRTIVDITALPGGTLQKELAARGAELLGVFPQSRSYRAEIALDQLEAIAALPEVRFIQPKQEAFTQRNPDDGGLPAFPTWNQSLSPNFAERARKVREQLAEALLSQQSRQPAGPATGSVNSQGDTTHRANTARSTFGANGAGVRIGVLSDGVTNMASSQATGDLPATVTVLPGQAGDGDEGTAMLEIIHDLAPGAQLYFATALNSLASFAQNIRDLHTAGCDIIVDDVGYFAETPMQDGQAPGVISTTNGGLIAQAVNDVTAGGALYFTSAGNSGNKNDGTSGVWEGDFVDGGANALLPGGTVHNFSGGTLFNTITLTTSNPGSLFWSDPLGASANDYDLFVLNSAGTSVVTSSTTIQNGTQDPVELVGSITANNRLVILKKTGSANRFLHLNTNRGRLTFNTPGQTHGHGAGINAYSVAATPAVGPFPNPFNATNTVETFSSDGPRRLLYNADSTPITPGNVSATGGLLRQKPDITAADGVAVTGAGGFSNPFFGTSAASPHAGAIAALLKSANPSLTPAQIRTALTSTAIDIETAGADRDSGAGIIMAFEALQSIGAMAAANFETGTITATETNGDGDGLIEPGESGTLTVQLRNTGAANATAISATLTTATPGVSITQGVSTYSDLSAPSGSGNNTTPFIFSLSGSAACPLRVEFALTISYTGGPSPRQAGFSVQTGPPTTVITSTLDTTAPTPGGNFTTATGLQSPRLNRNGVVSACGAGKTCPGTFSTGTRRYDAYTFTNCDDAMVCIAVTLTTPSCGGTSALFAAAYLGAFDPNNLCTNYLADAGVSPGTGAPTNFSFNVPAGGSFTIVVNEANSGSGIGCNYTLDVTSICCATSCPTVSNLNPTSGPVGGNVTITGTNFTGVNTVKFTNNVNASFTVDSATQITATVPAGAVTGPITINKTNCPDVTTATFTVTGCPTINLSPPTLPNGTVGNAYNQTLTGSGGAPAYGFTVLSGALPAGLSLSSGGVLSGTPSAANTFNFTVQATDANGCTGTQAYAITISLSFVVTNTNDSGGGSLRQALLNANGSAGLETITFNIPGAGPHTISPVSGLPILTDPVIIDGTTQPGFAGAPLIEINGASAGAEISGLIISAGGSTVRGLVINRFSGNGIILGTNGGNTIAGCYIGTNVAGTAALPNAIRGILILGGAGNVIGGSVAAARNVISGNGNDGIDLNGTATTNTLVQGNYIGVNAAGTAALGNGDNGIAVANANVPNTSIIGNVIAASAVDGIEVGGPGTLIQGNFIGTDATGTLALGNTRFGLSISAPNVTVGGASVAARNVISGNNGSGLLIINTSGATVQGNYLGVGVNGTTNIGNGNDGVWLSNTSNNSVTGNVIANQSSNGIHVVSGTGNLLSGNSIFANAGLGIELDPAGVTANDVCDADTGANNLQNFPVLTAVNPNGGNTTIIGTLNSTASTTFTIQFFASPTCDASGQGEGQTYLGQTTVTTNGSCTASFNVTLPVTVAPSQFVTATATSPTNDTSEFSACLLANNPPAISAVAAVRQQGSPASNSTIANVSDADQAEETLMVTVNGGASATVNGITVSGISVNSSGVVTADVIAGCTATAANFTLTVTDAASATANAMLTVTVTANNAPLLAYTGPQNVLVGGTLNVVPAIGPSDNGSINSIVVQSITPSGFTGSITAGSFGVVAISNAGPANSYTVTIRATDNCGAPTDASFRLVVGQACTSIGFAQPAGSPISTSCNPMSLAVGDFNLDGLPDMVVGNECSSNVAILLGNGSGGFSPATGSPISVGNNPRAVEVVDFNLDGKPDIGVVNHLSNSVTILLGDGSGGFSQAAGSPVSVGNQPLSLTAGDFNLDGKPDLAVANHLSNNVTILMGNGNGDFAQASDSPIGAGSLLRLVVTGDFNLDGKPDIAVVSEGSNNVTILLGNGGSGFSQATGSPISVGSEPHGLALGDFNLDGKPDLATANTASDNVTILLGNGVGGFSPAGSPLSVGDGPISLAVGDLNLDGKPDLTVVNYSSGDITLLLGNGSGGFTQPAGSPLGGVVNHSFVEIGDFNLDGRHDLAVANRNFFTVTIQLNTCISNTPPTLTPTPVARTAGSPSANSQIATVSDAQDALNTLTVTVNGAAAATVNGVTIANLAVDSMGKVMADVVASCTATNASFTLRVTDSGGLFADAPLNVTVNPNPPPTLTYAAISVSAGGSTSNSPTAASDNGGITAFTVQNAGTYTGTISVDNSTGVVSISGAKPGGTHTITIRATDNCGLSTDATFTLTVNCATITVNPSNPSLPSGTVNTPYNQTLTASGGLAPYSFTVIAGALPTGLSLSTGGVLNGTPSASGSYNFTVKATDQNGCAGTQAYSVTINPPPSCVLRPSGMVSWWTGNGNALDSIGSNHGALQNGATITAGLVGQAFSINGPDDIVRVPHNSDLNVGTGDVTIDAWMKLSNLTFTNDRVIMAKVSVNPSDTPFPGYLFIWLGGKLRFIIDSELGGFGSSVQDKIVEATITRDTNWHHVAAVRRGLTMELFYDGVLVATATHSSLEAADNPADVGIGNLAGSLDNGLPGLIDELEFFNRALSAAEIAALFNAGSAGKCNNDPPTITAGGPLTRQQGSTGTTATIATVNDTETPRANLVVTVMNAPAGINITNISAPNATTGEVTATVTADCTAATGANIVVLKVTDSNSGTATANLTVTVTANTPPVLTYSNHSVVAGNGLMFNPATGPSDNGSITAIVVQSLGTYTGAVSVDGVTGQITLLNAAPVGTHTVTIRATDNCGATTDASFMLTVNVTIPTLGNYPNAAVITGGNTTVTPTSAPVNAASMTAATSTNFKGTLAINPTTGVVTVTNAHVAGIYTLTVTAFSSNGGTATKTFTLTVNNPANCSPANFGFITSSGPVVGLGSERESLALGDFNGDGIQDLAKANSYGDNVAILLGNGGGSFAHAAGSPVSVGTLPYSVVVGDFNGDGKQDLAVANRFSSNATILLGNGSGGFSPSTGSPVGVGSTPISMTVGDFNGDRKQDLAVVNLSEETTTYQMVILLGDGSGGFTPAVGSPLSVGSRPFSVVAGDFNNDNKQDLAVANVSGSSVRILLGNGNGGFSLAPGSPINVGSPPYFVAVGNFNGDGNQDLVTTNSESGTVSILLGDGSGGFFFASSPSVGAGPASVAVGDFNGDGQQDLATANHDSNNLTILLGNGSGGFSPAAGSPFSVGAEPISLVVGDFNGDGKQDLVTARFAQLNSPPFPVTILLNNCAPIITAASSITRQQGSPAGAAVQIATVNDAETPLGNLTVTATTVPTGISIGAITNTNGAITATIAAGCNAATGNNTVVLTVTDGNGSTATANLTVNVTANSATVLTYNNQAVVGGGALTINPVAGPSDNGSISSIVVQSQGTYTGTISVNASGVVSISNAVPGGVHTVIIRATDNCGAITDASFTLTVNCQSITVNPPTIPGAIIGQSYSQSFTQTGGLGVVTFSLTGNLPPGLSFNAATATISGTPTQIGSFSVTIKATDVNGCMGAQTYSLPVNCPVLNFSPAFLPDGAVGAAYNQAITITGGTAPYSLAVTAGSLPGGLTLSSSGTISGTPTQAGTFVFSVTATDANNCGAQFNGYQIVIAPCPTISLTPETLPNGMAGIGYNQQLTASGGVAPYGFSISGGALPSGMGLFSSGVLSGTPATFGTFNFTVKATDANGCMGTRNYDLVINPPCGAITITPAALPNSFIGAGYNQTLTASGGVAPYTFSVSSGSLPGGFSLSPSGGLSGTASQSGVFSFVVKATDAAGCMGTREYTIVISGNGLMFYALPKPIRLLETRAGQAGCDAPGAPIPGGASGIRTQFARRTCDGVTIPLSAQAITGNITVVPPGPGFLTLFPSDAAQPTVANSNFKAGEVTNNFFTVGLGADGAFKIFTSATTHLIIDVTGYYAPPQTNGLFYHPLPSPVRLVETRSGQTGCFQPPQLAGTGNPNADPNLDLQVQGRAPGLASPCNSIPSDAVVLVGNATTVLPAGLGYLTIYPSDAARPTVASSNYAGNDVINGPFAVKLGADGKFKIYTFSTTDLVVDISGYYSTSPLDANGEGLLFNPLTVPMRLLETRPDFPGFPLVGCYRTNAPVPGAPNIRTQQVWGTCADQPINIPNTARAIVGNVTVLNPLSAGFLTFFPGNVLTAPTVATSNYPFPVTFGYNRHYYAGLSSSDGTIKMLSQFTTDLIVDVSGYFAP